MPSTNKFPMKAPAPEAVTGIPPAWTAEGQVSDVSKVGAGSDVMLFDPVKDLAPPQITDNHDGTVMGNKVGVPLLDLGISKAFANGQAPKK